MFDDLDPVETNYLGAGRLPLLPLTKDHHISMTLQLSHLSGEPAGHLSIALKWMLPYNRRAPSSPPHSAPPSQPKEDEGSGSHLTRKESEEMASQPHREPIIVAPVDTAKAREPQTPSQQYPPSQPIIVHTTAEKTDKPSALTSQPSKLPAPTVPDRSGAQNLDTESEFSDITPMSSLEAPMLSLSSELKPLSTLLAPSNSNQPPPQLGRAAGESPVNPEDDDPSSVSVSVTEFSEVEEEIKEGVSNGEDTMFEETLTQPGGELAPCGLRLQEKTLL